jgi:ABC-type glycerol-3-phosphate transport system substrate-binding protein
VEQRINNSLYVVDQWPVWTILWFMCMKFPRVGRVALLLFLFVLTGCGLLGDDPADPAATPTALLPTPADTPSIPQLPTPDGEAVVVSTPSHTLTLWTTPDISPRSGVAGGGILAGQLAAFREAHPDLQLNVAFKVATGTGNTLSYLRNGQEVAPSILPDLVLLPADQLAQAAAEQLIVPLDNLLPREMIDDLYPAARTLAQVNGQTVGYPFALTNLQHASYNPAVITDTLPLTWQALEAHPTATFAFPAGGSEGGELALQLYLAAGGELTNSANEPMLEVETLASVLNLLGQGRSSGLVVPQSSNAISLEDVWRIFEEGNATVVETKAAYYLGIRDTALVSSQVGPVPGPNGPVTPLLRGWAWAISTQDPVRQALAVELLTWLAAAPNLGDWSWQSRNLPARRSAFEQWPADDAYITFLQIQLEQAVPYPAAADLTMITALQGAVYDVIFLSESPQVAAEGAATVVRGE